MQMKLNNERFENNCLGLMSSNQTTTSTEATALPFSDCISFVCKHWNEKSRVNMQISLMITDSSQKKKNNLNILNAPFLFENNVPNRFIE